MIIFVPKKAKRNKIITSFSFAFFKKNYANIYKLKNNIKSKKIYSFFIWFSSTIWYNSIRVFYD